MTDQGRAAVNDPDTAVERPDWRLQHVPRETLARLIYQHWCARMVEAGHGEHVYVWESGWVQQPFIEAVSVMVDELLVWPMADRVRELVMDRRPRG